MSSIVEAGRSVEGPGPRYQFRGHPLEVSRGHPVPLGASRSQDGVNFVLICRHATSVRLVLSEPCNPEVETEIPLGPRYFRTGDHWHVRIHGLPDEFCYGYRVDGPEGPTAPLRPEHRPDRPRLPGPLVRPALGPSGGHDPAEPADPRAGRPPRRPQPADPPRGHDPLRAARPRVHRRPIVGRPPPGDVRRPGREDRLPRRTWASPRSSCCRSTSSTRTTARSSTR